MEKENQNEKPKEFKYCSTCKKKIGFFRKRISKKQDKSGKFQITQSQFCSPKCSKLGYEIYLGLKEAKINGRLKEREEFIRLIDSSLIAIARSRRNIISRYGSLDRVPKHEMPLLYSGAYRLLENMKEKVKNAHEKKENKR